MAEEFVRKEHFDEHVLRIDERFAHLEDTMNQRFLSLEKRMDLDAAHVGEELRSCQPTLRRHESAI